jgi:hypothetical protein
MNNALIFPHYGFFEVKRTGALMTSDLVYGFQILSSWGIFLLDLRLVHKIIPSVGMSFTPEKNQRYAKRNSMPISYIARECVRN